MAPRLRAVLAAVLTAVSLTVLAPSPAFACSCAALTTAESVEGSDAVLLGTVARVAGADENGAEVYEVGVDEVFAGMLPSTVTVSGSPEPCRTRLRLGEQYVMFASGTDGEHLATDWCSGTTEATPALVAEVELRTGAGRPPYDLPGGLRDDTAPMGVVADVGRRQLLVGGAATAFLILAAGAVLVIRNATRRTE